MDIRMALALFCLLCVVSSQNENNEMLLNHSYAFISGWAQSGTSFVHQILDHHSMVSSMIHKCEAKLGKRCVNWNHEGQWILKGSTRQKFKSGLVCPIDSWDELTCQSIRSEWKSFWDISRQVLVEKSPQSLLKFPALYQAFRGSQSVSIIIVLKHPVTLNIATPRTADWAFFRNNQHSMVEDVLKKPLDLQQKLANIEHFSKFMLENATALINKQEEISLGWLPAMEQLVKLLHTHNWTRNAVRIIRYEEFHQPAIVCRKLFRFVFRNVSLAVPNNGDKVCASLFQRAAVATTAVAVARAGLGYPGRGQEFDPRATTTDAPSHRTSRGYSRTRSRSKAGARRLQAHQDGLALYNSTGVDEFGALGSDRRDLRLRSAPPPPNSPAQAKTSSSFVFRPDLVQSVTKERMIGFADTYHLLPGMQQERMQQINDRLLPFGYDLFASYFSPEAQAQRRKKNVLAAWEL